MDRTILHCDCNCFYASVECVYHPELRHRPVAVCGDPEMRHGIILTKNYVAARYGIQTGEAIWEAQRKCPDLVVLPTHFDRYIQFAEWAREIYCDYTDRVEPFGLDEAWLDVTGDDGLRVAKEISARVKAELGITLSIGVSFNKVFSKFGSDYKKPDAITCITRDNFRDIAWPSPVSDLLYVGRATTRKLNEMGVYTIGDMANLPAIVFENHFGKIGLMLHRFACGEDGSPVKLFTEKTPIKSIGNSTTTSRDMKNIEDAKRVLLVLCDAVGSRLRGHGLKGKCIKLSTRDSMYLITHSYQQALRDPTDLTRDIYRTAVALLSQRRQFIPLRSIGVAVSDLSDGAIEQLNFYDDWNKRDRWHKIDTVTDHLHKRFGNKCIGPASLFADTALTGFDPQKDHTVHPVGFLKGAIE